MMAPLLYYSLLPPKLEFCSVIVVVIIVITIAPFIHRSTTITLPYITATTVPAAAVTYLIVVSTPPESCCCFCCCCCCTLLCPPLCTPLRSPLGKKYSSTVLRWTTAHWTIILDVCYMQGQTSVRRQEGEVVEVHNDIMQLTKKWHYLAISHPKSTKSKIGDRQGTYY